MKKLITMFVAILATACLAAFAAGNPSDFQLKQAIVYQMSFSRIVLSDDIDLRLKESNDKFIDITGNNEDVEKVNWKIKDNVLFIESKKGSLRDKVQVTLHLAGLKELQIEGESNVSSAGSLRFPELYQYINAGSHVAIKTTATYM